MLQSSVVSHATEQRFSRLLFSLASSVLRVYAHIVLSAPSEMMMLMLMMMNVLP